MNKHKLVEKYLDRVLSMQFDQDLRNQFGPRCAYGFFYNGLRKQLDSQFCGQSIRQVCNLLEKSLPYATRAKTKGSR